MALPRRQFGVIECGATPRSSPARWSGARHRVRACVVGLLLIPGPLSSQPGQITGVTLDAAGNSLVGTRVSIDATNFSTFSGTGGVYVLVNVAPGSYSVRASRLGYDAVILPVVVASAQTTTRNFVLAQVLPGLPGGSVALLPSIIDADDHADPLPVDSIRLPVPDSAIVRKRQARVVAFAPRVGQRILLALFKDATFTIEFEEVNATANGYRANGRVLGPNGQQVGTAVIVRANERITANVRYGLRLFQIRSQARGIHLIVEVNQLKVRGDTDTL